MRSPLFVVRAAVGAAARSVVPHSSFLPGNVAQRMPALERVRLFSSPPTGGASGPPADGTSGSDNVREVRIGSSYEKGQVDPSVKITIVPPVGHEENTDLAQQLGIYKCRPSPLTCLQVHNYYLATSLTSICKRKG